MTTPLPCRMLALLLPLAGCLAPAPAFDHGPGTWVEVGTFAFAGAATDSIEVRAGSPPRFAVGPSAMTLELVANGTEEGAFALATPLGDLLDAEGRLELDRPPTGEYEVVPRFASAGVLVVDVRVLY